MNIAIRFALDENSTLSFFTTMSEINIRLMFEGLLASFLLGSFMERRDHFVLRVILFSLLDLAIGYCFPIYYNSGSVWPNFGYWLFLYLSLMALLTLPIAFSYKGNWRCYMMVAVSGYVIHQLFSMLDTAILDLIEDFTTFPTDNPVGYEVVRCFLYFILLGLVYFLVFHFYFKQKKENLKLSFNSRQALLMMSAAVIFTIILSALQMLFISFKEYDSLARLSYWVDVFEAALLVGLLFIFIHQNRTEEELDIQKELLAQSKKQYELSKENIESLNLKFHDFKYRIQAMEQGKGEDQSFEEIYKDLAIYDAQVKTGNQALDIVLSEYALRCENNDIVFSCIVDGKELSFLSPYDTYALFGNAINNAIEAVSKIKEKEKRVVSLVVRKKGTLLSIHLENYFDGELQIDPNTHLPLTSKENKLDHGYGTRSIKLLAEKYGGQATFSTQNDIFLLDILLPIPEKKEEKEAQPETVTK